MILLLVAAILVFFYSIVSGRLERSILSAPMIFTAVGLLVAATGAFELSSLDTGTVGVLAEATLILVLFTDAIRIDLRKLRSEATIPARLLTIGLPLTLLSGSVLAYLMFESLPLAGAFVLGAILTPTDAALGKPVVSDESVPVRIRQTINVESGLNDGIMLPLVTVAVTLLAEEEGIAQGDVFVLLVTQIGIGALAGLLVGWLGGKLLDRAVARGNVEGVMLQLGTLAIGVAAFAAADVAGGNGFVSAFVAGLAFAGAARERCQGAYDFAADEGELLTLLTFLVFGVVAWPVLHDVSGTTILYAVASLTVVRMIPVALALLGTGMRAPSVMFIGWFGPRGLASILFGVFLLEESGALIADALFAVVVWVVLISIFAHGASAPILSRRYGTWYRQRASEPMMESVEVFQHPLRG